MSFQKASYELARIRQKADVHERMRVMIKFNNDGDKARFLRELQIELKPHQPGDIGGMKLIHYNGIEFEFVS